MHRRGKKSKKRFFPKCFTLCYKLCGWVVQSSSFQNVCYLEVSDLGSTGHFVDLDQENASVWSPSPETNLKKYRPPCVGLASGAARRRGDKPGSHIRPREAAPHQPRACARRNQISRSGGAPPHSDKTVTQLGTTGKNTLVQPASQLYELSFQFLAPGVRCTNFLKILGLGVRCTNFLLCQGAAR